MDRNFHAFHGFHEFYIFGVIFSKGLLPGAIALGVIFQRRGGGGYFPAGLLSWGERPRAIFQGGGAGGYTPGGDWINIFHRTFLEANSIHVLILIV